MEAATTDLTAASLILATAAVLVAIMGSTLTIVILMFKQFSRQEDSIKSVNIRLGGLEAGFTGLVARFDGLETRFTALEGKVDAMGYDVADTRERVARIEGYLMASEGFTLGTPQPPVAVDPPPEDPAAGKRQAG